MRKKIYEVGELRDSVNTVGCVAVFKTHNEACLYAVKMAVDEKKSGEISITAFAKTEGTVYRVISASGRCWLVNERSV